MPVAEIIIFFFNYSFIVFLQPGYDFHTAWAFLSELLILNIDVNPFSLSTFPLLFGLNQNVVT